MIDMLSKDDDDIDLVFQALSKKILNDGETEDIMEELNATVTKHVRKARAKRTTYPQMDRACSIPMIGQANCNVIPSTSVPTPCAMLTMPALQRMNNFASERELTFEDM